jgi:dGTP triphosphohydrolase
MTIEKLNAIPTHVKGEDGYYYDQKYVGNLYKFNDKLLYFTEKTYMEFPIKLYTELETLVNEIKKETDKNIKNLDDDIKNSIHTLDKTEDINTINISLDTLKQEINDNYDKWNSLTRQVELQNKIDVNNMNKLSESIDKIYNDIDVKIKFLNDYIKKLESKIDSIDTMTKESIESIIDQKLSDVYENFKNVSSQLTKSAVQEALKDSKRDQVGKLKMSSLAMLKELDYKPEDIKLLSEAGLI